MARRTIINRLKMRRTLLNNKNPSKQSKQQETIYPAITKNLKSNVEAIKRILGVPSDLIVREFVIGELEIPATIVYISGITDENLINDNILKTMQLNLKHFDTSIFDHIQSEVIAITNTNRVKTLEDVSLGILNGGSAFYLDGEEEVLLMGTDGGEARSISEPESETLIRGPRDGFVESINTNMALIRRDIKDQNLRFKEHIVGKRSNQKLVICYMEGIVNPDLVEEITRRIDSVDIDFIPDSSYIEQWIEDSIFSPFPQIIDTERPDSVSSSIMQGKVGIIVDGTPFALIAPMTFSDSLSSPEDYTQRWLTSSLLRMLRFSAAFVAIFLPGLYVALVSFHPGMIPSTLAYSISASREGVPFPAPFEAILMAITFEILHEAGVRLPNVVGQTIGIVGGLVIGEAAVSAGIVSPIMVVVTALTAIAAFSIPSHSVSLSFRMFRFIVILAGGSLGLYGIVLVYIMITIHLVNLKSIGIPYATPFAPTFFKDLKDVVIRAPITNLIHRPEHLKPLDDTSKDTSIKGKTKKQ